MAFPASPAFSPSIPTASPPVLPGVPGMITTQATTSPGWPALTPGPPNAFGLPGSSPGGFSTGTTNVWPTPQNLMLLTSQLGTQTHPNLDGSVTFNEPLLQQLTSAGEAALPGLNRFLMSNTSIPGFVEAMELATRLTMTGVPGTRGLYPAVSRWNTHPDPLVQISLARFYRATGETRAFGPLLSNLVNRAVSEFPMVGTQRYNATEEAGRALLSLISSEVARRLSPPMPMLSPNDFQPTAPQLMQPRPGRLA